ncbi:CASP-like protein 2A1 [Solanum dulcamara]|uniref:CASP-like protein 2A1 n=1 Tax=Solanum dulcamara TaxID=45834 RepID=UPI0024851D54|nr:CASP-like protein 2A1 [Solanum dulcamara]
MGDLTQKNVVENENNGSNIGEIMLRLLPIVLCVVALVIMLKDSQTNDFGSLSYSDLGTFRYLVHANGICAAYSLLSAIVAALPHPTTLPRAWTFFLLDQILTYIMLAAGAASTEVMYLAYKGDTDVTWSETCGSFGGFCKKATASVSITFIVSLCYVGISLLSSYRLFSKYDAPIGHYNKKGSIEIS